MQIRIGVLKDNPDLEEEVYDSSIEAERGSRAQDGCGWRADQIVRPSQISISMPPTIRT